jgi:hypothetical protein
MECFALYFLGLQNANEEFIRGRLAKKGIAFFGYNDQSKTCSYLPLIILKNSHTFKYKD